MLSFDCPVVELYSFNLLVKLSVIPILHLAGSKED